MELLFKDTLGNSKDILVYSANESYLLVVDLSKGDLGSIYTYDDFTLKYGQVLSLSVANDIISKAKK